MSGTTETDIWPVSKLVASLGSTSSLGSDSGVRVRIPRSQRRLVWNQAKREALIKSVLEGFPIGSLLLWRDPQDRNSHLLVDGQQRSATLKAHAEADLALLTESALEASTTISASINNLVEAINADSPNSEISIAELRKELLRWLLERKATSDDSYHNASLLKTLSSDGARFTQTDPAIADRAQQVLRAIEVAVNVSNMKLPVLIYTGPDDDLDAIFVKLNEQGVALTKYQVWSAKWRQTDVPNPGQEVLAEQDNRLLAMRAQGLQYQEEGPTTSVNFFEYLNSIGHIFADKYPDLFAKVEHPKEQAFGFSVALLYFDLDLARKSAEQLPEKINKYGHSAMSDFYKHFDHACQIVSKTLRVLAAIQLRNKTLLLPHPDLQIISLIAWMARELRAGRKADSPEILEAVNARYVLDLLTDAFRGPGDKLAFDRLGQSDSPKLPDFYRIKPAREVFSRGLESWISDDEGDNKKKRPITQESLKQFLLRAISSKHLNTSEQAAWAYDVDHIQALASDVFKESTPGSQALAPHQFGNLCLLAQPLNNQKRKQELSEFLSKLDVAEREFVIRVGRLEKKLTNGEFREGITVPAYLASTRARSAALADELMSTLKY